MVWLKESDVAALDWTVVGLSGVLLVGSAAAMLLVAAPRIPRLSSRSQQLTQKQKAVIAQFTLLWPTRISLLVVIFAFGLIQPLRLQVCGFVHAQATSDHPQALTLSSSCLDTGAVEPSRRCSARRVECGRSVQSLPGTVIRAAGCVGILSLICAS